ncbi:hypothetical protein SAMN05421595_2808 [Austwickia chelonae]|uniref:Uncharacterized protein n=1 Tax=Austwickia chelonae NBRC 105200 TaxID=1184607 RepID=K6W9P2_9MICO|nr:hypothetical protein [Austwickia chelonae]GAB78532.1 hypothetical protein AUCHE_09_01370 [Austwickia chelonae NBRC 105200]SEW40498.1 hypothetical protein SAMN05421595_2808 [Austwickia chelonae]
MSKVKCSASRVRRRWLFSVVAVCCVMSTGVSASASGDVVRADDGMQVLPRGGAVRYRAVPLPELASAPRGTYGIDLTDDSELLAAISWSGSIHDLRAGYLVGAQTGTKVLASPPSWNTGVRVAAMNERKKVVGVASQEYKPYSAAVRWETPTSPAVDIGLYPSGVSVKALNAAGDTLVTNRSFSYEIVINTTVIDGPNARKLTPADPSWQQLEGTDLADDGTAVGLVVNYDYFNHRSFVHLFIAPGNSAVAQELELPSSAYAVATAQVQTTPDGARIVGQIDDQMVVWDAMLRGKNVGKVPGFVLKDVAPSGAVLAMSQQVPVLIRNQRIHPIEVWGVPAGAKLIDVTRINRTTQISGTIALPDGRERAVLLTPIR